MNDAPKPAESVARLLAEIDSGGSFAASHTTPPDDLRIEVEGVEPLEWPLREGQARALSSVARPARYGKGEDTLLDRSVRDTWEIPAERLRIDEERWARTLDPALDELRRGLGLDATRRLAPELHNLLVYGPGQFFLPHRDSEKSDDMVATLVVTLPSTFSGGTFEVEHAGDRLTFLGSPDALSFVAFYADCRHQVRPVKDGYRVVLTYNLSLAEGPTAPEDGDADPGGDIVDELTRSLRTHFETRRPPRWAWTKDAPDRDPPSRLVYLLDHQYSQRGLSWHRLKGDDAPRVRALGAAAARVECEVVLAVAEIHETWSCFEEEWDREWGRARHRRWTREEGSWIEEDEELEPPRTGPDQYDLHDLQDSSVALTHWLDADGSALRAVRTLVDADEVCHTTANIDVEPYASEYEGFMGNWGNTMDRWYRRAAVVMWPRARAFPVRAEAAPRRALDDLVRRLRKGEVGKARTLVRTMLPDWDGSVAGERGRKLFGRALRVAEGLKDSELAEALLEPLRLEYLTPRRAAAFAALVRRYEEPWSDELLARWSGSEEGGRFAGDPDPLDWIAGLPPLCQALLEADSQAGWSAACLVLWDRWEWLAERARRAGAIDRPGHRAKAIERLAAPLLGLLQEAAVTEARDVTEQALAFLSSDDHSFLLPCLIGVLRAARSGEGAGDPPAAGLDRLRQRATSWLRQRLSTPARAEDDWSLELPAGCDCERCQRLAAFLSRADERRLEWPLAKAKRKHVHRRIDGAELPVRHETRRTGRPYTLVLTKTDAIFEREASERRAMEADLAWLEESG